MRIQSLPMRTGYGGTMPDCIVAAVHVLPKAILSSMQLTDRKTQSSIHRLIVLLKSKVEMVTLLKLFIEKWGVPHGAERNFSTKGGNARLFQAGPAATGKMHYGSRTELAQLDYRAIVQDISRYVPLLTSRHVLAIRYLESPSAIRRCVNKVEHALSRRA